VSDPIDVVLIVLLVLVVITAILMPPGPGTPLRQPANSR